MSKGKPKKKQTSTSSGSKLAIADRRYPRAPLSEAVELVLAIRQQNGGNPWSPSEIAKAMDKSHKANSFFYLTSAARDFGLTTGTRSAQEIALTEFGRRLAYAETSQEEEDTRLAAFFNVPIFKEVVNYYKGSTLPEMKFLSNTLENKFGLPPEAHQEFAELFRANCEYVGLREGIDTNALGTDKMSPTGASSSGSDFVTVAEPEKDSGLSCFVAMPFNERDKAHGQRA